MGVWCNEPIMRMGTPAVWQSRRCSEGGNMLAQRKPSHRIPLLLCWLPSIHARNGAWWLSSGL